MKSIQFDSTSPNPTSTPYPTPQIWSWVLVAAWLLTGCSPSSGPIMELPKPDLAEVDTLIVEQIQQAEIRVKQKPSSASAWAMLGVVYWVNEFRDIGSQCLNQAVLLDPDQGRWVYYKGLSHLPDQIPLALPSLKTAADLLDKQTFAPRLRLANVLAEDGQLEAAKPHYEAVLSHFPDNPMAILGLGRVAQAAGEDNQAIEYFEQCRDSIHTRKAAHVSLANLYLRQGKLEASEGAQKVADTIELDEEWMDPYLDMVKPYKLGKIAWMDSAGTLMRLGKLAEAQPLVNKIIQHYPDIPKAYIYQGKIHLANKQYPLAETALRKSLSLDKDSIEAMVQLGVSLLWQNKHADAIELFERAIELSPELAEAYYNLALAQSSLGDGNSAKMAFAHTIRLNPGIAEAYVGLATLFIQDNELANALKTVRKGLEASPEHPGLKRLLDGFEIQR